MGHPDDRSDARQSPLHAGVEGSQPGDPKPAFRWIPIRSLAQRHRHKVLAHLLALPPEDRYLRFGYAATEAQIGRYVDLLDFDRDEVFGIFNRKLELIAHAHLAYLPDSAQSRHAAEFGVSVLPKARGRGYGARLFDHAVLHARNRQVEREGGEAEARLRLPPETLGSVFEELVENQAGEIDYQLKSNAKRVSQLRKMFGEVKAGIRKVRSAVIE